MATSTSFLMPATATLSKAAIRRANPRRGYEGVRIQQVDRAVIEGHPLVGRADLADMKLFCSTHDGTLLTFQASVQPRLDEPAES